VDRSRDNLRSIHESAGNCAYASDDCRTTRYRPYHRWRTDRASDQPCTSSLFPDYDHNCSTNDLTQSGCDRIVLPGCTTRSISNANAGSSAANHPSRELTAGPHRTLQPILDAVPVRVYIPQRIVISVLILIEGLRFVEIRVERGILRGIISEVKEIVRTTSKLVRTCEPSLSRRVVPREKVIQPRFVISFFLG
jgi:hypothetical protein